MKDWLRRQAVIWAYRLVDFINAILFWLDLCHICGDRAHFWCESCGNRMCGEHDSPDWADCNICTSCDDALEASGDKAECQVKDSD